MATAIVESIYQLDIKVAESIDMDESSAQSNHPINFNADFSDINESNNTNISNSNIESQWTDSEDNISSRNRNGSINSGINSTSVKDNSI